MLPKLIILNNCQHNHHQMNDSSVYRKPFNYHHVHNGLLSSSSSSSSKTIAKKFNLWLSFLLIIIGQLLIVQFNPVYGINRFGEIIYQQNPVIPSALSNNNGNQNAHRPNLYQQQYSIGSSSRSGPKFRPGDIGDTIEDVGGYAQQTQQSTSKVPASASGLLSSPSTPSLEAAESTNVVHKFQFQFKHEPQSPLHLEHVDGSLRRITRMQTANNGSDGSNASVTGNPSSTTGSTPAENTASSAMPAVMTYRTQHRFNHQNHLHHHRMNLNVNPARIVNHHHHHPGGTATIMPSTVSVASTAPATVTVDEIVEIANDDDLVDDHNQHSNDANNEHINEDVNNHNENIILMADDDDNIDVVDDDDVDLLSSNGGRRTQRNRQRSAMQTIGMGQNIDLKRKSALSKARDSKTAISSNTGTATTTSKHQRNINIVHNIDVVDNDGDVIATAVDDSADNNNNGAIGDDNGDGGNDGNGGLRSPSTGEHVEKEGEGDNGDNNGSNRKQQQNTSNDNIDKTRRRNSSSGKNNAEQQQQQRLQRQAKLGSNNVTNSQSTSTITPSTKPSTTSNRRKNASDASSTTPTSPSTTSNGSSSSANNNASPMFYKFNNNNHTIQNIVIPLPAHRLNDRSLATGVIVISQDHGFPANFLQPEAFHHHHHPHHHHHHHIIHHRPAKRPTGSRYQASSDIGRHYHYELLGNGVNGNLESSTQSPSSPKSATSSTTTESINHFNLPIDDNSGEGLVEEEVPILVEPEPPRRSRTIARMANADLPGNNKFNDHEVSKPAQVSSMKARIQVSRPQPNVVNIDLIKTTTMTNHDAGSSSTTEPSNTNDQSSSTPASVENDLLANTVGTSTSTTTTMATPTIITPLKNDSALTILVERETIVSKLKQNSKKRKEQNKIPGDIQRISAINKQQQSQPQSQPASSSNNEDSFILKRKVKTTPTTTTPMPPSTITTTTVAPSGDDETTTIMITTTTIAPQAAQITNDTKRSVPSTFPSSSAAVLNTLVKELNQALENRMKQLENMTAEIQTLPPPPAATTLPPETPTTTIKPNELTESTVVFEEGDDGSSTTTTAMPDADNSVEDASKTTTTMASTSVDDLNVDLTTTSKEIETEDCVEEDDSSAVHADKFEIEREVRKTTEPAEDSLKIKRDHQPGSEEITSKEQTLTTTSSSLDSDSQSTTTTTPILTNVNSMTTTTITPFITTTTAGHEIEDTTAMVTTEDPASSSEEENASNEDNGTTFAPLSSEEDDGDNGSTFPMTSTTESPSTTTTTTTTTSTTTPTPTTIRIITTTINTANKNTRSALNSKKISLRRNASTSGKSSKSNSKTRSSSSSTTMAKLSSTNTINTKSNGAKMTTIKSSVSATTNNPLNVRMDVTVPDVIENRKHRNIDSMTTTTTTTTTTTNNNAASSTKKPWTTDIRQQHVVKTSVASALQNPWNPWKRSPQYQQTHSNIQQTKESNNLLSNDETDDLVVVRRPPGNPKIPNNFGFANIVNVDHQFSNSQNDPVNEQGKKLSVNDDSGPESNNAEASNNSDQQPQSNIQPRDLNGGSNIAKYEVVESSPKPKSTRINNKLLKIDFGGNAHNGDDYDDDGDDGNGNHNDDDDDGDDDDIGEANVPGVPGIDYPIFGHIPDTSFECSKQQYPGFYSDMETGCQVYHSCSLNSVYHKRKFDMEHSTNDQHSNNNGETLNNGASGDIALSSSSPVAQYQPQESKLRISKLLAPSQSRKTSELIGGKHSFLCPNGTIFSQEYLICDWWYNVKCDESPRFYPLNRDVFASGLSGFQQQQRANQQQPQPQTQAQAQTLSAQASTSIVEQQQRPDLQQAQMQQPKLNEASSILYPTTMFIPQQTQPQIRFMRTL